MSTISCQRCKLASSGPQAFLLTCRECSKSWHHRCHMPPVEDVDLIQLIRATNAGDTANGLDGWMCRRCKKRASETPGVGLSRNEPATSSESREDIKVLVIPDAAIASATHVRASTTADLRVKQERSATIDARAAAPVRFSTKRTKPSTANQAHAQPQTSLPQQRGNADVQMADAKLPQKKAQDEGDQRQELRAAAPAGFSAKRTKQPTANQTLVQPQVSLTQQRSDANARVTDAIPAKLAPRRFPPGSSSPTHSRQVKAARKLHSTVSLTATEDEVEMEIDPTSLSESTSRASHGSSPARSESAGETLPRAHATNPDNERERETSPTRADIQPPAAADPDDDDPEDLYGPPVERQIVRILPSLAEELREQQRRVAAEKGRRRAPLAPDWIFTKHLNDPLWKEVPVESTQGRKRRKPVAGKLDENVLNVNELMGCFTVQNWVREHKI